MLNRNFCVKQTLIYKISNVASHTVPGFMGEKLPNYTSTHTVVQKPYITNIILNKRLGFGLVLLSGI